MAYVKREVAIDLLRHVTAWIIDICRAIKNGGGDNRLAALDHAEEIVDACLKFEEAE